MSTFKYATKFYQCLFMTLTIQITKVNQLASKTIISLVSGDRMKSNQNLSVKKSFKRNQIHSYVFLTNEQTMYYREA